jgi:hypothetical protein
MSIEDTIRTIVVEELAKQAGTAITPLADFCEKKNISRVTIWRAEKSGKLKLKRIGRKVFVDESQVAI